MNVLNVVAVSQLDAADHKTETMSLFAEALLSVCETAHPKLDVRPFATVCAEMMLTVRKIDFDA